MTSDLRARVSALADEWEAEFNATRDARIGAKAAAVRALLDEPAAEDECPSPEWCQWSCARHGHAPSVPAPAADGGEVHLHDDVPVPVDWWWTPKGRAHHDADLRRTERAEGAAEAAERIVEAVEARIAEKVAKATHPWSRGPNGEPSAITFSLAELRVIAAIARAASGAGQ